MATSIITHKRDLPVPILLMLLNGLFQVDKEWCFPLLNMNLIQGEEFPFVVGGDRIVFDSLGQTILGYQVYPYIHDLSECKEINV